ncbi:MAG: cohesin domain-containing protein [Patescibacteria group bacterium]
MVKNSLNNIIALSVLTIALVAGLTLIKSPQNIEKKAAPETKLFITPSFQEINLGKNFTTIITLDSGENKVTGIDLQLSYDPNQLKVDEIKQTSEISSFNTVVKNEIDSSFGKLRYSAFTFDKTKAITGKLNILTIYGSVPSSSSEGSYEITIDEPSIVIAVDEGQNVLTESGAGTIKIIPGEPNSCGGTCGSNDNCKSNYFCFEGFCRNPVCPSDKSCGCTVTTTATAKATTKPVSNVIRTKTPSPRPKGGEVTETSPRPTPTYIGGVALIDKPSDLTRDELDLDEQSTEENMFFKKYGTFLIFIAVIASIITVAYALYKKKMKNIPHIMPPTNI